MGANDGHVVFGCFFERETDVIVRQDSQFEGAWSELVAVLAEREVRPNKFGSAEKNLGVEMRASMFSLAKFEPREGHVTKRANWFVTAHSGIVFDLDVMVDIDDIRYALRDVEYFAYTTHSHDPSCGATKWRIVFPLLRPVPAAAYKAARMWVAHAFPKAHFIVDPAASALSTAYFLPSCPQETLRFADAFRNEGLIIELPPVVELRSSGGPAMRKISKSIDWPWARAKMLQHERLREAFKAVLKGKPFAPAPTPNEPGSRNDTLSRMCGVLAGWYPYASPDELAEIFRPSLEVMTAERPDDPPEDVAWAANNIETAQSKLLEKAANERLEYSFAVGVPSEKKETPEQAPIEALSTPAQDQRIEKLATDNGLDDADALRRALILQRGKSFWVWNDAVGSWNGPWQEREIYFVAEEQLVSVPGVQLWRRTQTGGIARKSFQDLFFEHGRVLNDIHYDLTLGANLYDARGKVLRLATPIRQDIQAEEAPQLVQDWIEAIGGRLVDKLLDWLALMLRFDMPSAALFIQGKKGTGKSLFARALSQLWAVKGPTPMKNVDTKFNDALLRCPLVWIEEGKWKEFGDPTIVLRQLITEADRYVERKHQELVSQVGHLRLVASVNNFNMFAQTKESLTPEDRDAVAERFLPLDPTDDATRILREIGPREKQNRIVDDAILAKHVLWLQKTRNAQPGMRFAVEGDTLGSFADRMITDDKGWGAGVTQWLAGWFCDPLRVEREGAHKVYRGDGQCIVNPQLVVQTWSTYVKNNRPPEAPQISDALRSLSVEGHLVEFPQPNPHGMCGFRVKTGVVIEWMARTGLGGSIQTAFQTINGSSGGARSATVVPIRQHQAESLV